MSAKVALVVPSTRRLNPSGRERSKVGGSDMRFASLYKALDSTHGCVLIESPCERSTVCQDKCAVNGSPVRRPSEAIWYYDSTYCPVFADIMAGQLIASGVSTVVCSSLNVYRYVLHLAAYEELTVVFDMHNVESVLYRDMRAAIPPGSRFDRVLSAENAARIEVAERAAIEAADELWTCSDDDRALAVAAYGISESKPVTTVPDVVEVPNSVPDYGQPSHVVFTARLDYYPNILAAEVLLRDIAPLLDPLPVVVAGAQPDASLLALRCAANARLVADPASMAEIVRGGIMVVPLRYGGGSRFKIIEAFASGAPVVSTRKGAEGLGAVPGVHYLSAESQAEFAAAVRRLLGDGGQRERIVRAGWELARDRNSLSALTAQVSAMRCFTQ